jgi:hypothetical protein
VIFQPAGETDDGMGVNQIRRMLRLRASAMIGRPASSR